MLILFCQFSYQIFFSCFDLHNLITAPGVFTKKTFDYVCCQKLDKNEEIRSKAAMNFTS